MASRYQLTSEFYKDEVVHTTYRSDLKLRVRKVMIKTRWMRQKELGTGAFGVVWSEENKTTGELRAVKIIPKQHFKNLREVDAMAELQDHPELFVLFLGWFEDQHSVYIAMEYIEHGDLSEFIDGHGDEARAAAKEIARQLLEGLMVLHARGICHRDLKPQNVLIASTSPIWVKISDFGISKRTIGTSLRTTCGTMCYKAPEQLGLLPNHMRIRGGYTTAVDLWALGAVIHQVLTSEIPFLDKYFDSTTVADAVPEIDMQRLFAYCNDTEKFPKAALKMSKAGQEAIGFVKSLMAVNPSIRVSAKDALDSSWLRIKPSDTYTSATGPELLQTQFQLLEIPLSEKDAKLLFAETDAAKISNIVDFSSSRQWVATAVTMGYLEVVKILLKLNDVDEVNCYRPLLFQAAGAGQIQIMEYLLNRGATINLPGQSYNALVAAAGNGHLDAMRLLLNRGADVNADTSTDVGSPTALQAAAQGGYLEAIRILLDNGANINAVPAGDGGLTAVQAAAEGGHLEVLKLLIVSGGIVDQAPAPRHGRTAMQAASECGHLDVLEFLLDNGAEVDEEPAPHGGLTALQAAAKAGHLKVTTWLLEKGGSLREPPAWYEGLTAAQAAAKSGHLELLKYLCRKGQQINHVAGFHGGRTALQAAAEGGHLNVLQFLLKQGADVSGEAAPREGTTAFQVATEMGNLDAMKLLLQSGEYDIDTYSQWKVQLEWKTLSALEWAVDAGELEVVKLLLRYKAAVTPKALDSAASKPRILAALNAPMR